MANDLLEKQACFKKAHKKCQRITQHGVGFFITRIVQYLSDGRRLVLHSRWQRKGLPPVRIDSEGKETPLRLAINPWLHFWAPGRLAWWIALLFLVGSACFALGSFTLIWPQYSPEITTGHHEIGAIFFMGSLFFTSASWLQLLEAINGDIAEVKMSSQESRQRWRWFAWKPLNAGYSSSLIQFVGTLFFNLNTGAALLLTFKGLDKDVFVWIPNVMGSLCFLASSYVAMIEVSHSFWSFQPRQISWWVVFINLVGSIGFMVAALFGFLIPSLKEAVWMWGDNFFVLVGGVCFFIASYLLIPELFGAGRAKTLEGKQSKKF